MNDQMEVSSPPIESEPPISLWNSARLGFVILIVAVSLLIIAVANGVADPKPVGSLKWEEKWLTTEHDWQAFGPGVSIGDGRLEIEIDSSEIAGAITPNNSNSFSFEVAGGQTVGEVGAAYGIIFDYQSEQSYTAILINGNGYVEVTSATGTEWLAWQQWPNILLAYEANRVRIDAENGQGLIRINDEVLITVPVNGGALGLIARGSLDGQRVRFGWAKYWSR